jgi:hypothetical protein
MNNKIRNSMALCLALLLSCSLSLNGQKPVKEGDLKHWPKGSSPQEIGNRIAEHFVASPHFNYFRPTPATSIVYPETCTWYGALTFAKLTGNNELIKKLSDRFEPLFESDSTLIPKPNHVDNTVFGAVPLELYIITKDKRYLKTGLRLDRKSVV